MINNNSFNETLAAEVDAILAEREQSEQRGMYKLPITTPTAERLLLSAYCVEVKARTNRDADLTTQVRENIHAAATWATHPEKKRGLILYGARPGTGKSTLARALNALFARFYAWMDEHLKAKDKSDQEALNSRLVEVVPEFANLPAPFDAIDIFIARADASTREQLQGIYDNYRTIRAQKDNRHVSDYAPRSFMLSALEIANKARDETQEKRQSEGYVTFDMVKTTKRILFIDDLGTEPLAVRNYGNEIMPLTELLLHRYDKGLPTVITTNLGDQAIADTYGPRILDRLNEMYERKGFNNIKQSFRK